MHTPQTLSVSQVHPNSELLQAIKPSKKSAPPWRIQDIPAFGITIERRQDRWKRFQDQSGIDGLPVKRFLGVDGKTLDPKTDDRIAVLTKRNILANTRRSHEELDTIGGVGCALSHIAVWQWLVDHDQEACLVFEDDAVVPPDFIARANACIQQSAVLPSTSQWDIWLLGGTWDDVSRIPHETQVHRVGAFVLFHAYVITRSAAQRLLRDVYPIHAHIDVWVSIYAYMNDVRVVGCPTLKLLQHVAAKTDIQLAEGCALCNVPTEFHKTHQMVSKTEWRAVQVAAVLGIGLLVYVVVRR